MFNLNYKIINIKKTKKALHLVEGASYTLGYNQGIEDEKHKNDLTKVNNLKILKDSLNEKRKKVLRWDDKAIDEGKIRS